MAAPATLPALLDALTKSLSSALEAAPKLASIEVPKDGLSLLDVKNELLLSYLQNLVFLIIVKLRQAKDKGAGKDVSPEEESSLADLVVRKLVELRLYLEKGVRPLEDKLRYQIEKVLRAADDAERSAKAAADQNGQNNESDEESEDEDADEGAGTGAPAKFSDLQYRPNLSAFVRPAGATGAPTRPGKEEASDGIYRPPRIAPTVMPTTTTERREKAERQRPMKSATLDEFIADELSAAPVAEPSIGTTIVQGGRKVKTARDRQEEDERREYEESNFVRLPKETKKQRAEKAKATGGSRRMNFGGEEWRDLGEGVDRINRLTQGGRSSGGTKALLEKSRKRGLDTTDGPRGSGAVDMGERFSKKLKYLEKGRGGKKR
ncbi:hypothetical protein QBC46DRAFT_388941 [Diplogelasinospora grovesii]|uniref:Uncharacterized protein n=1 Tax=Diplogelasinospora grovesii TaxID=303347 RepID=A0AAN6N5Q5_9PEZI|nr:hypothetical protein QBC46DRAFT_388941 [Diplogelasinospora grovesii]